MITITIDGLSTTGKTTLAKLISQKYFIKNNNTVMEGRDIGSRIAPDAFIKFYLYSNFEKRV